jgi:hypothetical protein
MTRIIYNADTKEIIERIDNAEGTTTSTPYTIWEGSSNNADKFEVSLKNGLSNSISAWQAHTALKLTPYGDATLYDAVVQILNALPDGAEKILAITAFQNGANFERNSPTILNIATVLGLDSDEIDELFTLGASLTV